jgi:hypothetical protein
MYPFGFDTFSDFPLSILNLCLVWPACLVLSSVMAENYVPFSSATLLFLAFHLCMLPWHASEIKEF